MKDELIEIINESINASESLCAEVIAEEVLKRLSPQVLTDYSLIVQALSIRRAVFSYGGVSKCQFDLMFLDGLSVSECKRISKHEEIPYNEPKEES